MKKLAIIGPAFPYRGGIASFSERLALEFQSRDWEVQIFTFTLQYPSIFFPGKNQLRSGSAPDNLKISRTINSINPFSWRSTGAKINDWSPDLVIAQFWHPYLGPALGSVIKSVRAKTISIMHNVYPHERSTGDRYLSERFVTCSDLFIALSQKTQTDLEELTSKENILLLPHPVYDNYGEITDRKIALDYLNLDSDFQYILFFGLVRAYKGLDLLINAFSKFSSTNDKVKLLVAGEFYDDEKKYTDLIEGHSLQDKVIVHNKYIADEDVKYYFSACDLVAQTYKSATQSGISQIAIHFEKPILLTNVGGLKEIIEHGKHGYISDPDIESIHSVLKEHFSSPNIDHFQTEIKTLKQKYSWQRFTEKIIGFSQKGILNVSED